LPVFYSIAQGIKTLGESELSYLVGARLMASHFSYIVCLSVKNRRFRCAQYDLFL